MKFEWDPAKNQQNITKHGISFDLAKTFFLYEDHVIVPVQTEDELRMVLLCDHEGKAYLVVYSERGEGIIRIISARRCGEREASKYRRQAEEKSGKEE